MSCSHSVIEVKSCNGGRGLPFYEGLPFIDKPIIVKSSSDKPSIKIFKFKAP